MAEFGATVRESRSQALLVVRRAERPAFRSYGVMPR